MRCGLFRILVFLRVVHGLLDLVLCLVVYQFRPGLRDFPEVGCRLFGDILNPERLCDFLPVCGGDIPEDRFIKKDTAVCEDVMYNRLMAILHNILLAEPAVLTRWAEGVRKVMLAAIK